MSTRTIIEVNHDYLTRGSRDDVLGELAALLIDLAMSNIPTELNKRGSYEYGPGIRILGQRHHSEPEWVQGAARNRAKG